MVLTWGKRAEELGYDSLWVADHLMLGKDEAILEGWTVLSALAGATTRAKLGMIHMAHYFRHPSLTAKMAATLDQISGGRLIHFLDCGYQRREYVDYGLAVARRDGRSYRRPGRSHGADPAALGRRRTSDVPRPDLGGDGRRLRAEAAAAAPSAPLVRRGCAGRPGRLRPLRSGLEYDSGPAA